MGVCDHGGNLPKPGALVTMKRAIDRLRDISPFYVASVEFIALTILLTIGLALG